MEIVEVLKERDLLLEVVDLYLKREQTLREEKQHNEFLEAFVKAQAKISYAAKTKKNEYYGSKYATLADVFEAIREPLSKFGIAVIQTWTARTVEDGVIVSVNTKLRHTSGGGEGMTVELFVPTKEIIESKDGEKKKGPNFLQRIGGAVTYMKRYSLATIAGVPFDDDDDGNSSPVGSKAGSQSGTQGQRTGAGSSGKPPVTAGKPDPLPVPADSNPTSPPSAPVADGPISPDEYRILIDKFVMACKDMADAEKPKVSAEVRAHFGVKDMKDLPKARFKEAVAFLENYGAAKV